VNLNIKTARSGNHYVELDTYEPPTETPKAQEVKATPKAQVVLPEPEDDRVTCLSNLTDKENQGGEILSLFFTFYA
jgi:hypothetical protein